MRKLLVQRLSSVWMVLASMAGYVVWETVMRAIGASSAMAWTIAAVLVLGGVVWATPHILRYWPIPIGVGSLRLAPALINRDVGNLRRALSQVKRGWRFGAPLREDIEPDVEHFIPLVRPAVERTLVDILEDPLAIPLTVESGTQMARIKRIRPSVVGKTEVPALLLAYTTGPAREPLIPRLALSRAVEGASELVGSGDEQTVEALQHLMDTVADRLDGGSGRSLVAEN